jgi:hypothetical protein
VVVFTEYAVSLNPSDRRVQHADSLSFDHLDSVIQLVSLALLQTCLFYIDGR